MYLLDTNVLSDAYKRIAEPLSWLVNVEPTKAFVSVITIGEIERGVAKVKGRDSVKAVRLSQWLRGLRDDYNDRLLPITEEIAIAWGRLSAGRSRSEADALIAATALVHDLILVTRNVSDFEDAGVTVLNPWTVSPGR